MSLRRAGHFRELRHGEQAGPSLRESLQSSPHPDEKLIVQYLENASTVVATGSMVDDILNAGHKGIAKLEIATDGTWIWPRDLAYYVHRYHARLPHEFVDHMRELAWTPPEMSPQALATLGREMLEDN